METPAYMSGQTSRGIDPEHLRLLGKKASALHSGQGTPLTEAVVNVLREEPGLTPEHVNRVVEFANNQAFELNFSKSAGDHRVIDFDGGPADRSRVLQELRSGDREGTMKTASRRGMRRSELFVPGADGFESRPMTKTASAAAPSYPMYDPHRELFSLRDKLKTASAELSSRLFGLQVRYDEATRGLRKTARELVLSGHSPVELSRIYVDRSPHAAVTKLAHKLAADGLTDVPAVALTKEASDALGRPINPAHPVCAAFDEFVKVAVEFYGTQAALGDLRAQLDKVNVEVKKVIQ